MPDRPILQSPICTRECTSIMGTQTTRTPNDVSPISKWQYHSHRSVKVLHISSEKRDVCGCRLLACQRRLYSIIGVLMPTKMCARIIIICQWYYCRRRIYGHTPWLFQSQFHSLTLSLFRDLVNLFRCSKRTRGRWRGARLQREREGTVVVVGGPKVLDIHRSRRRRSRALVR